MSEATKHSGDCEWHLDQYPWECTCGLLPRMTYAEWIAKRPPLKAKRRCKPKSK